jgi:rare lipoprotein A
MKQIFLPIICLFLLTGCTQTELVSHVAKKAWPGQSASKSEGYFKVGTAYTIAGKTYVPRETYSFSETGIASWYGPNFHGKPTANGETFDMNELTAAHRTLQLPSLVRVTNLENGRSLIVRVNDRGPFKRGRIIDLSKRAAELLDFKGKGTAKVKLQVLSEESKAVAQAAKRGEDTSGVEIAMNENRLARTQGRPILASTSTSTAPPQSLEPVAVQQESLKPADLAGHVKQGKFLPDPVVRQLPVSPSNIYVQAGSFGNQNNAVRLASALQNYGESNVYPAMVNGKQFYRVRIGPMGDVDAADGVLDALAQAGNQQAIIVVD